MMNQRPQRCRDHARHQAGCLTCRAHATWYFRLRRDLVNAGEWDGGMVDAAEAHSHAAALYAAGMSYRRIGEKAGISEWTIAHVAAGTRSMICSTTAAAVLGVTLDLQPFSQVPAAGSIRRVRAMIWQGRTRPWISAEARVASRSVQRIANGTVDTVTLATRDKLAALLHRHIDRPVPDGRDSRAARREAHEKGWHGPGAWNDIDDPGDVPDRGPSVSGGVDEVAIAEVLAGRLRFKDLREQERVALFRDHLDDWGYTPIMELLRMSAGTVTKWRTLARYGSQQVAA